MFYYFDSIFSLFFLIVFSIIIFTIIRNVATYIKNNNSPVQTEKAVITGKRSRTTHNSNPTTNTFNSSTTYYTTFEFEDGTRHEFRIKPKVYGLLSEQDTGILQFQGTRFLDFTRDL